MLVYMICLFWQHEEKDLSNLVLIKEESFEVDAYPSCTGNVLD